MNIMIGFFHKMLHVFRNSRSRNVHNFIDIQLGTLVKCHSLLKQSEKCHIQHVGEKAMMKCPELIGAPCM